jgi:sugar phosphate permease
LQPDGRNPQEDSSGTEQVRFVEDHWTPNQVLHTPLFWVFSLGMCSLSMLSTGLHFHIVSIFEDNQLDPAVAAAVFVPIALTTALVNFGSGILVDRMPVRAILAGALVLQTVSLLMAQSLASVPLAILYGMVLGASGGLQRTVSGVIWATYFGRRYLGTISGISSTMMVAGSALGPLPFGVVRDLWGSYNPALLISSVFPFVLAIVCLFFDKPRKPAVP